jgi:Putative Flp pilus-assembly TadE/G-like
VSADRRRDAGSTLLLVPVGVLVVFALGVLVIDVGRAFLAQREASSVAVAIANDLATVGLDGDGFQRDGGLALRDGAELAGLAETWGPVDGEVAVERLDDRTVRVTVRRGVEPFFGRGRLSIGSHRVEASAVATLEVSEH